MTTRKKWEILLHWLAVLLINLFILYTGSALAAKQMPRPAPEFTHQDSDAWLNSKPLSLDRLRGKVILLDFWTFDCWSCYRSFAWLTSLEDKYRDRAFRVIGIHTPEFEHERRVARVREKIAGWGLEHPVMIDNDFSYWNAVGARSWPSFYLVDKKGVIRASYMGETRIGDDKARAMEQLIDNLLAE